MTRAAWLGLGLLVAGLLLARRGVTWIRPVTALAALWTGFFVGFAVSSTLTCTSCLA